MKMRSQGTPQYPLLFRYAVLSVDLTTSTQREVTKLISTEISQWNEKPATHQGNKSYLQVRHHLKKRQTLLSKRIP